MQMNRMKAIRLGTVKNYIINPSLTKKSTILLRFHYNFIVPADLTILQMLKSWLLPKLKGSAGFGAREKGFRFTALL